jgi:hypothetical protein
MFPRAQRCSFKLNSNNKVPNQVGLHLYSIRLTAAHNPGRAFSLQGGGRPAGQVSGATLCREPIFKPASLIPFKPTEGLNGPPNSVLSHSATDCAGAPIRIGPVNNWGGRSCERKSGQTRRWPNGIGGSKVEVGNKVWPDFLRNPKGRGQPFSGRWARFRSRWSLEDARYSSLLAPRTRKNWLPSPPVPVVNRP